MYVPFLKNVKDCLKFVLGNLTTQFNFLVLACCLTTSHSDRVFPVVVVLLYRLCLPLLL